MEQILASPQSWIEGAAIEQLKQTAALPGVQAVVGLPDLHPGKGCAVGSVCYTEGIIYPHLVGNDIGCGLSLYQTTLRANNCNARFLASCMTGLDLPWQGETQEFLYNYGVISNQHNTSLGTVGGGNHFAELQKITSAKNAEVLKTAFIDSDYLMLLVHSGSRSYGETIFRKYANEAKAHGLASDSTAFSSYMDEHNDAVKWAKANRGLIAYRMLEKLDSGCSFILDIPHNFIEPFKNGFLHRKGAAPANQGLSPLPGSRGTNTHLLNPNLATDKSLYSLAHGAGRKASRASMHKKFNNPENKVVKSKIDSVIVCNSEELMHEEDPSAYKSVEQVLRDLEAYGLAVSVATLSPVVTYKSEIKAVRNNKSTKRDKEYDWREQRRRHNRG
jgi:release factor H-coupled RctB family protein